MVRIAAASISVLFLTIAAVKAQIPIVIANYPPANQIPPTNSPQVQAWLKELDLTGAPNFPLHTGAPPDPSKVPALPNECWWTSDGCAADDLTACAAPNTWGLTFDDGPSQFTPALLDYLKAQKLSATFFLIGSNVIQNPQIALREVKEGHHLASHTWSHNALTTLTNEQIVAEMKWTEKAVLDATGLRMKYMRPPYGDINNRVRFVLKKMGYIPVDWTGDEFDTNDWRQPVWNQSTVISTFSANLDKYVAGPKTKGFYCLEHDVKAEEVAVAQKLIPLGQAKKINFASVAGCESDAAPYQIGGTAPMPSVSGTNGVIKPTGTSSGNGTNPTGGPTVIGRNAGSASATVSIGLVAVAAAVVGAFLA
ncbi:chitin deacetylase [Gryganskiella cystojenkinii]|nr:chitin deacetylase [Gryganskiella cystojenkinii]